jgi:hypothetical protein
MVDGYVTCGAYLLSSLIEMMIAVTSEVGLVIAIILIDSEICRDFSSLRGC